MFEVDSKARLVDTGQAVDVQVTVICPAGAEVLEVFLLCPRFRGVG